MLTMETMRGKPITCWTMCTPCAEGADLRGIEAACKLAAKAVPEAGREKAVGLRVTRETWDGKSVVFEAPVNNGGE